MNKLFAVSIMIVLSLTACQKEIDLDLENKSGQLVIEGNLSDLEEPQLVRITRSVAFTEPNEYPEVSNAFVTISDNMGLIDTLSYISDGVYRTNALTAGVSGRTYTLSVVLDGNSYTAQSELPNRVELTGLQLLSMNFFGTESYDVLPQFVDPSSFGNHYAFIVTASSKQGIVFETETDNIGNGMMNQLSVEIPDDGGDPVKTGDIVFVQMRCIDKNIFDYYQAIEQLSGGGPGGGVTPSNPPSNISNGALGYFSAHTSQTMSVKVD